jgi:hypothetical protein
MVFDRVQENAFGLGLAGCHGANLDVRVTVN